MTTVERQLRRKRQARGLSLRSLAQRVGVDAGALSRYENGAKILRSDTLARLAAGLDLEIALVPRRSPSRRFIDGLCDLQAQAILADPELVGAARSRLTALRTRSANAMQWEHLLDAGVDAIVAVLASNSPAADALKADSPFALIVEVTDDQRRHLSETCRAV